MRGHLQSGTRRLNAHWQSGKRREKYDLRLTFPAVIPYWSHASGTSLERDFVNAGGTLQDISQVSISIPGKAGDSKEFSFGKVPFYQSRIAHEIESTPYVKIKITFKEIPQLFSDLGANLYLANILPLPSYMVDGSTASYTTGSYRCASIVSEQATATEFRKTGGRNPSDIPAPQVVSNTFLSVFNTVYVINTTPQTYGSITAQGFLVRKNIPIEFGICGYYDMQDMQTYEYLRNAFYRIMLLTDYVNTNISLKTGLSPASHVFTAEQEAILQEQHFVIDITAEKMTAEEYATFTPCYALQNPY